MAEIIIGAGIVGLIGAIFGNSGDSKSEWRAKCNSKSDRVEELKKELKDL